jgi:hypothetical protein
VAELDLKKSKEELSTLANEHDKLNAAFKEQLTKIKAQTNRNLTRTYNSGFVNIRKREKHTFKAHTGLTRFLKYCFNAFSFFKAQ